MGKKGLMIILLLALLAAPAASANTGWSVSVENDSPYLGDMVVFEVNATVQLAFMNVVLQIFDSDGGRVLSDVLVLDIMGYGRYYWQTSIYDNAGNYTAILTLRTVELAEFNIELVYDEIDYLFKRQFLLEDELRHLYAFEKATREKTDVLDLRMNAYIHRWGMVLSILLLASMVWYNRDFIYQVMPPQSKIKAFIDETWRRHSDGVFTRPDYIKSVPVGARVYCKPCKSYVAPDGHDCPAAPTRARVKPIRRRKFKVVANNE